MSDVGRIESSALRGRPEGRSAGGLGRGLGGSLGGSLGGGNDIVAGRYALVDPIASGGAGTVWRAYDHELEQWCAAKVMRQRNAGELLRFAREQSVRLQHPHIASPYAWAADDETVLIASELVDGGSLHTLIGDYGPLDEPTAVVLLDQVLSALSAMHEAGLVHRDVKPGNILLRATGEGPVHCMLTDFGLTIGADEPRLTQTGMVIGTPGYIPPEVMLGTARPHPSHDVYAAGRLALTLALGLEPRTASWPSPDHEPTAQNTDIDERIERLVEPQLQAAVRLMTEAEPGRRPVDAQAAMRLLAGIPRSSSPHTVDGDPVTVFDQLPRAPIDPLRASGPGPLHSDVTIAPTDEPDAVLDAVTHEPDAVLDPVLDPVPVAPDAPAEADGETTVMRVRPTAVQRSREPEQRQQHEKPEEPDVSTTPAAAGRRPAGRRRSRRDMAALIAAVVLAGGGTVVAAASGWGPFDDAKSSTGPTGPVVTSTAQGEACGWQQQGDAVDTADGRLTCRLVDGAYVWGP